MPTKTELLLAELEGLRAENEELRAARAARTEIQALTDRHHQSQVRFRTIFDNSPLGQKIVASDLTIRQANPALVAMLRVPSPAALVGRRILEFAHPHHRYDWHLLQERLWEHRTPNFALETCLVRPDGSSFWVQVTSVLFPDEDGEMGYTTLEDISARKQAEADLKRLYDAQETVLHLVAHDLKSPLANIQLLVDVLLRDEQLLPPASAATQQEARAFLALIRRANGEASALLRDVLYLGELDANKLHKQSVEFGAYLDAHLQGYHLRARENGVALTLARPAEPLPAAIDPRQFGRVLDNLLTNAFKFTPRGGRIGVAVEHVAGQPRLRVQDSGIGVPAPLQARVFDKFSAAARPSVHGEKSTGLGLFITQQIVRLHGGRIWLESQEGVGTTFFVELP